MILPVLSLRRLETIPSVAEVVAVVRIEEGRVARARQRMRDSALHAANTRAKRDSTRRADGLNARVARIFGNSSGSWSAWWYRSAPT